ncbi:MAG: hypothetical protein AB1486_29645 [Planctomycetota bacterium]
MTEEQPVIMVARPCPSRHLALERLVTGQLRIRARDTLQRHMQSCVACRGYHNLLLAHDGAVRDLLSVPPRAFHLADAQGLLTASLSHLAEADAARALVALAEWHFARRERADPTLYMLRTPRSRSFLRGCASRALEDRQRVPWSEAPAGFDALTALLDLPARDLATRQHRQVCRDLIDLALELDDKCYLARIPRMRLVREENYSDIRTFERDCEALMSSDQASIQARAFAYRAAWIAIVKNDTDQAVAWHERARDLDPGNVDFSFNSWFFNVVRRDVRAMRRSWSLLRLSWLARRLSARPSGARAFACTALLDDAMSEGHLSRVDGKKAMQQLRRLIGTK